MAITTYEGRFLIALLITITVEFPLILLAVPVFRLKAGYLQAFLSGIFVSLLTLPYLWFIYPRFYNGHYIVVCGEGLVILAETFLLFWLLKCKFWKAFSISLLVNLASYFIGRLVL